MSAGALLGRAREGALGAVELVHGPDLLFLDDLLAAATRGCFPDDATAMSSREVFDGEETALGVVIDSARTLPLWGGSRLIAVRRAQALAPSDEVLLTTYCADPAPTTRLLLLADEPLSGGRSGKPGHWLLRAVPARAVTALERPEGRALEAWLRERVATEGIALDAEGARLLVDWVGDEPARLVSEARKASQSGPGGRVGTAEVSAIVGEQRVRGVYDLVRALESGDRSRALALAERLLETVEPVVIALTLAREARSALAVLDLARQGKPVAAIARAMRRPERVVEAVLARPGGPRRAWAALERCWATEARLKSGGAPAAEIIALVGALTAASA